MSGKYNMDIAHDNTTANDDEMEEGLQGVPTGHNTGSKCFFLQSNFQESETCY